MRILVTSILSLAMISFSFAQNIDDAIRYSKSEISGTARYTSMGGAFGALGGDLSAISDNPAAVGVFMYSEFNFTPTFRHTNTQTDFLENNMSDNKVNFNLNNLSFVASIKIPKSKLKSINYAFSYKKLDNFSQRLYAEGYNHQSSITDNFAEQAYGTTLGSLDDGTGGSDLVYNAYNTYLINPVDASNSSNENYVSALPNYGQQQFQSINTKGRRDEFTATLGGNYNDKLYVGATLAYSTVKYVYESDFQEHDRNGVIDGFKSMQYKDEFTTTGYGYMFKVGFIYKALKWLRIGSSIQTPTMYYLTDDYTHTLSSFVVTDGFYNNYTMLAPSGTFEYRVLSPMKAMGSLGFVIKKKATIGIEYEFVNYKMSRLSTGANDYVFNTENDLIKESLKAAHNVKFGLEYRLGKVSLRTGLAYLDAPYNSDQINKDAYTLYYSGGLGINLNHFYIDFAYSYAYSNYYYIPYQLENKAAPAYKVFENYSKYITTIGFRF